MPYILKYVEAELLRYLKYEQMGENKTESKEIMELVARSEGLIQWIDSKINGLEIPSDDRTRLAAGCHDMAMEHHKSIVLLVSNSLYGSAFSLVRLIYETYVRGVWLYRCANDREVEKFKREKINKSFGDLLSEIKKVNGYESGTLSQVKESSWDMMNSFTHSGFTQIVRRITESSIEPNYDEEEIRKCLYFSSVIGLLSSLESSLMAKNKAVALNILEKSKEFSNENP